MQMLDEIPTIAGLGHNKPPSEMEMLQQRLDENYQAEAEEYSRLSNKEIPTSIEDEKQAGQVTDFIKAVKALGKRIETGHKKEKQIYLDCGRVVDNWKKNYETNLFSITSKASEPLNAFLAKKAEEERERQRLLALKARQDADKLAAQAAAHATAGIQDTADELMNAAIQSEAKADMLSDNALDVRAKARSVSGASASQKLVWTGEIEALPAVDLEALRKYLSEDAIQKAINAAIRDGLREIRGVKIFQKSQISVR